MDNNYPHLKAKDISSHDKESLSVLQNKAEEFKEDIERYERSIKYSEEQKKGKLKEIKDLDKEIKKKKTQIRVLEMIIGFIDRSEENKN